MHVKNYEDLKLIEKMTIKRCQLQDDRNVRISCQNFNVVINIFQL